LNTRKPRWRDYSRFDPDRRARELKQQFQVVSKRSFGRRLIQDTRSVDGPVIGFAVVLVAIAGFIFFRWVWNSNLWTSNQMVVRATYLRTCSDAARVGVFPLYSGHPGYQEHLDRDRDGIACEPYPF
jgi:hypothetical protein